MLADRYMQETRMEADGTLARAVFTQLKQRFVDVDRASDLMGTMSAMGMIYFSSIEAATAALVERDLRISSTEAELVVDAGRVAVAQLGSQEPTVMVTMKTQAQKKARATKGTAKGARAPAQKALALKHSLDDALIEKFPSRKPKPRGTVAVDEELWKGAVKTIKGRISTKYGIDDVSSHYNSMCAMGRDLLASEIHREAQSLYDYRAGKLQYRANRRSKA